MDILDVRAETKFCGIMPGDPDVLLAAEHMGRDLFRKCDCDRDRDEAF
jgi:hypothetical protein